KQPVFPCSLRVLLLRRLARLLKSPPTPMSNSPAIEAESLVKIYKDWRRRETIALDGVSLSVQPGTIFGLIGRNGAGKTTLVKILLSLVMPTSGTAELMGKPVNDSGI